MNKDQFKIEIEFLRTQNIMVNNPEKSSFCELLCEFKTYLIEQGFLFTREEYEKYAICEGCVQHKDVCHCDAPKQITDQEIEEAANRYIQFQFEHSSNRNSFDQHGCFEHYCAGAKWYREQLNKQNEAQ